jgi:hypothetical protein
MAFKNLQQEILEEFAELQEQYGYNNTDVDPDVVRKIMLLRRDRRRKARLRAAIAAGRPYVECKHCDVCGKRIVLKTSRRGPLPKYCRDCAETIATVASKKRYHRYNHGKRKGKTPTTPNSVHLTPIEGVASYDP